MPQQAALQDQPVRAGWGQLHLLQSEGSHPGEEVPGPEAVQPLGQQVTGDGAVVYQGLHGVRFSVFHLLFSVFG